MPNEFTSEKGIKGNHPHTKTAVRFVNLIEILIKQEEKSSDLYGEQDLNDDNNRQSMNSKFDKNGGQNDSI